MGSVTLTSPPTETARLVVDTDVASFVFKWHPEFAPRYVSIMRGSELVVSFMTLAEMRQGALDANWGPRKRDVLETYSTDFSVLHSDSFLCSTWAALRNENAQGTSNEFSRRMDCGHGAGFVGAAGDKQS